MGLIIMNKEIKFVEEELSALLEITIYLEDEKNKTRN